MEQMNFLEKAYFLIEKDKLNEKNRKREIIYKKCYLQSKLRDYGMTYKAIGKMFNQNHASVIHNVKTHIDLDEYYRDSYHTDIHEYICLLKDYKIKPPKRNLLKDIQNANTLYALGNIKRWLLEDKYDIGATLLE
jgi:hypothetical protein